MPSNRTALKLTISALLAAAGLIASCAGMEPSKPLSQGDAEHRGSDPNASNDDAQRRIDQMREAVANNNPHQPTRTGNADFAAPDTPSSWTPDEGTRANPSNAVALDSQANTPDRNSNQNNAGGSQPSTAPTLEQRIADASADLATALRLRADRYPDQAASAYAAINALAMVEPRVATAYMPDNATMSSRLTPDERSFVLAWGEMSRQLPGVIASGDSRRGVARILRDNANRLDDRTLTIPTATLCYKVDGFGLYSELPRNDGRYKFLAGRANEAIVYVELDGFAYRSVAQDNANGYTIDLTQDVSLYEADSRVLAWRLTAQDISDFSRNQRHDFYMIQIIKLPASLTIGSYDLKVSVRDRTSQAVAEQVIRIDVVADASAIRGK